MIPVILSYAVILIALPVTWYATFRLRALSRSEPDVSVIYERTIVALVMALNVTVFAVVFVNNNLPEPFLDSHTTMVITRIATLALAGPPLYWLILYRNGRRL